MRADCASSVCISHTHHLSYGKSFSLHLNKTAVPTEKSGQRFYLEIVFFFLSLQNFAQDPDAFFRVVLFLDAAAFQNPLYGLCGI